MGVDHARQTENCRRNQFGRPCRAGSFLTDSQA
jgi:hypothetical protein